MITNKSDSQRFIERKLLNYNPYLELTGHTTMGDLKKFLSQYEYVAIRDPRPAGKFHHCIHRTQAVSTIAQYKDWRGLKIQPSLKYYDEHCLVLQGDIEIKRHALTARATLNDKPGWSLREATNNPDLLKTYEWDWAYDRDPEIVGLKQVIDYIFEHELFDMIVEFTLYSRPVGILNQPIIIWECRNY